MDDVRRLVVELIGKQGLSLASVSRAIGRNPAYLQQFVERGVPRVLPEDVRELLAPLLGRSPDELRGGPRRLSAAASASKSLPESNVALAPDAPPPWPRAVGPMDVPIYGVAEGGQDGAFVINMADGPIDYATRPMKLLRAQHVFAVHIQGDSMFPAWKSGDLAYCYRGRGFGADDFVIVQLEAGPGEPPRAIFKLVVKYDNDTLTLRQLNPDCTITVDRSQVREVWPVLHWREIVP